jgi:hypothetical protein
MSWVGRPNIARRFVDRGKDATPVATRRMLAHFAGKRDLTWEVLLPSSRGESAIDAIVLEAGSGTGKSTEARSQAERLRAEGTAAFYSEARRVASNGLAAALHGDDAVAYERWRATTSVGVLFVDAVDEVYLDHRSIDDLFRNLEREIDFATRPVILVMTARTGAWGSHEASLLEKCMRRRTPPPDGQYDDRGLAKTERKAGPSGHELTIRTLTFEPLDAADTRILGESYGASDPKAFHEAFEEGEVAEFIHLRPRDVELFVQYWNRHGRLGTWTEIAGWLVTWTYQELNPARRLHALSLDEYARGLKRVAAASVLCKQLHIVLPTALALPGAIQACELFPEWSPAKLDELFTSPLFVPKGESAVQLPDGAVTQCLAALWVVQRYRAELDLDAVVDALFARVPGESGLRLPDSRRALVGWAASALPELRKTPRAVAPDALLHFGDPSKLSCREISETVGSLVARKTVRHWEWPTNGTLARLARPELEHTLRDILTKETDSNLLWHLLRFVEAGSYSACVPRALELALDESGRQGSQTLAIRVVSKLGGDAGKHALRALLKTSNADIKAALVTSLVPNHVTASELSELLVGGCNQNLAYAFSMRCASLVTADLDDVLSALDRHLAGTARATADGLEVDFNDDAESALAHAACSALTARLLRPLPLRLPKYVERLPLTIQVIAEAAHIDDGAIDSLNAELARQARVRRAVWRERLVLFREDHHLHDHTSKAVAPLLVEDLEWLHIESLHVRNADIRASVQIQIQSVYDRADADARGRLRATSRAAFRRVLEAFEESRAAIELARTASKNRSDAAAAKKIAENASKLVPIRDGIRDGSQLGALEWAWSQLRQSNSERARVNVAGLVKLVGNELAEDCLTGFVSSWRKLDVPIPEAGAPSTPVALLVALTGVTVEYQRGAHFAHLTAAEAATAAKLAMYELNSFPSWLEQLVRAHPKAVEVVLRETISREWDLAAECHGVLRFAPYQGPVVVAMIKSIVFELAAVHPPAHPTSAHYAVSALLSSRVDFEAASALAQRFVCQFETEIDMCLEWARLWANTTPSSAAAWLSKKRESDPAGVGNLIGRLAGMLGRDFERDAARVASNFFAEDGIRSWLPLLVDSVRPEHDIRHKGGHVVGERDDAQDLRDRCLSALAKEGSPESYSVLESLRRSQSDETYRANIERAMIAHHTHAAEAAAEPWSIEGILEFEQGRDATPSSRAALFALVRRHLRQISGSQQEGEFAYPELFERLAGPHPSEEGMNRVELTVQRWVAATLQLVSRGLYTVEREPEKKDQKRVDICATVPGVGQVPIEIKPIGAYSFADLKRTIEHQLLGDYMRPREVTHGVLLLVRLVDKQFQLGENRKRWFADLVSALSEFADGFTVTHGKVISVETISLVSTRSPTKSKRGNSKLRKSPA